MKCIALAAALGVTACSAAPEAPPVANNVAMIQDALEREADNMEALADAASNEVEEEALENAADALEGMKGAIEEASRNSR